MKLRLLKPQICLLILVLIGSTQSYGAIDPKTAVAVWLFEGDLKDGTENNNNGKFKNGAKITDGGKFGKTEEGNIWLDPEKTSPYKFYQFWLNSSDEDSKNYIKIFTLKNQQEIEKLITAHDATRHLRILQ